VLLATVDTTDPSWAAVALVPLARLCGSAMATLSEPGNGIRRRPPPAIRGLLRRLMSVSEIY
jgi:hypothetical protein